MMRPVLTTYALSDKGRVRSEQEDAFGRAQLLKLSREARRRGMLYVVADGVGGEKAGELASKTAVQSLFSAYYQTEGLARAGLTQAIQAANRDIFEQAQSPDFTNMSTTIVCALIKGGELIVAHVGDSRAYLWRDGEISRLTNDHSWVAEQVQRGYMTWDEASKSTQRNLITRSLGRQATVDPEIHSHGLVQNGDRLLLCTDGLYDGVSDERIRLTLKRLDARDACEKLVELANGAGGSDNITVMVIDIQLIPGDDESAPADCELAPAVGGASQPAAPGDETEPRAFVTEPETVPGAIVQQPHPDLAPEDVSLATVSETAEEDAGKSSAPGANPAADTAVEGAPDGANPSPLLTSNGNSNFAGEEQASPTVDEIQVVPAAASSPDMASSQPVSAIPPGPAPLDTGSQSTTPLDDLWNAVAQAGTDWHETAALTSDFAPGQLEQWSWDFRCTVPIGQDRYGHICDLQTRDRRLLRVAVWWHIEGEEGYLPEVYIRVDARIDGQEGQVRVGRKLILMPPRRPVPAAIDLSEWLPFVAAKGRAFTCSSIGTTVMCEVVEVGSPPRKPYLFSRLRLRFRILQELGDFDSLLGSY